MSPSVFFCGFALLSFVVYVARSKEVLSMFRFAEAPELHDETSWSAWGTRRRCPVSIASGSPISACRKTRTEALVVQPTALLQGAEAASEAAKTALKDT